uniref:Cytochrome P450 CYP9GN5 n=1 Tax=Chrysoperla zastrowi sillemi TaxID=482137 RepID=A0A9E7Y654_9NEOP|nr:cytochrome P450 CYP9GN5 [Chrysoperla zastrowi sillemi]UZE89899.1 cytochrome P450 CYP9GN5 [Chrysoperla zastrowi sillemi]UZE89901.1 cytochrome P450 CYP9GN5 [Chrysoperla zastrowi sillemi]
MFAIIALIVILYLIHYAITNVYKYWESRGIPYYKPRNAYYDTYCTFLQKDNFSLEIAKAYNGFPDKQVYGSFLLRTPQLMVKDPDILRNICVKDFEHFTNHVDIFFKDDLLLGKSLFALKDKKWRDMRTILSPIFTGSKLRGMVDLVSECSEQTMDYYAQLIKQKSDKTVKVDILDATSRFTNDVIATSAFGIQVNSLADKTNVFFETGQEVSKFPFWRFVVAAFPKFVKKIFNLSLFPSKIYEFFRNIVEESIRIRKTQNIVRYDLIHLLLEAKKEQINKINEKSDNDQKLELSKNLLDIDDITAQSFIFFIAGFINVALTISFAGYELAIQPEIQDKLRKEIRELLQKNNGKLDYDILKKMKYLDMVVTEVLRKYPPAGMLDRVCTKAYTIKTATESIDLVPGMPINIPVMGLHYDPKYFPNPNKFDPERFNDENREKMNPYTYLPFGVGPRLCIASRFVLMEIKIFLVHLINSFEVIATEKCPIPMEFETGTVLKPKHDEFGIAIKLIK